ncbi:hypothetical protein ABHF33_07135 [Chitinibacter sp. FCG-7]|uniref:Lipoprotein n=1 Tax=Chitinibacter mangrovi TaxID=3153927 RepID=A0AAU7FDA8_9NEIS
MEVKKEKSAVSLRQVAGGLLMTSSLLLVACAVPPSNKPLNSSSTPNSVNSARKTKSLPYADTQLTDANGKSTLTQTAPQKVQAFNAVKDCTELAQAGWKVMSTTGADGKKTSRFGFDGERGVSNKYGMCLLTKGDQARVFLIDPSGMIRWDETVTQAASGATLILSGWWGGCWQGKGGQQDREFVALANPERSKKDKSGVFSAKVGWMVKPDGSVSRVADGLKCNLNSGDVD